MWANRKRDREREHKHGSRIVSWHHDIALAQDQQPDGQLPISSEQVDHFAVLHTLFSSLFPTSFALFSLLHLSPTPVTTHPFAHLPEGPAQALLRGLWKPDGIHSCDSVCVCMLACLLLPRQLATGPPELRDSAWAIGSDKDMLKRARHFMHSHILTHKQTHCSHHNSSSEV